MNMKSKMLERMERGQGFIAALDQSGGSTPKALKLYGISEDEYKNEDEMFHLVHEMRARIITSPVFTSERILGVILFEKTMNSHVAGMATAKYLWQEKGILSFLKVDDGLMAEAEGVQLMKPIPELIPRINAAVSHDVFGTKMRSVIKDANPEGIKEIVKQQFAFAKVIQNGGLVPIIEPEVDIKSPNKEKCEEILKSQLFEALEDIDERVIFKLTLPTKANLYEEFTKHPKLIRVVALSGGYTRHEANELLSQNRNLIASFSRALTEGLKVDQTEPQFNEILDDAIESIYLASTDKK